MRAPQASSRQLNACRQKRESGSARWRWSHVTSVGAGPRRNKMQQRTFCVCTQSDFSNLYWFCFCVSVMGHAVRDLP